MSQFHTYLPNPETNRHWLLAALALALLCLLAQLGGESAQQALKFQRPQVLNGAWWQIITAHFLHYSWGHLGLNMLGLLLLPLVLQPAGHPFRLLAASVFLASWIGIALLFATPSVGWYLGFSGVLTGLYILESLLALAGNWQQYRAGTAGANTLFGQLFVPAAVLLIVGGKVVRELNGGAAVVQHDSLAMPVLTSAHYHGAIAGGVLALLVLLLRRARTDRK